MTERMRVLLMMHRSIAQLRLISEKLSCVCDQCHSIVVCAICKYFSDDHCGQQTALFCLVRDTLLTPIQDYSTDERAMALVAMMSDFVVNGTVQPYRLLPTEKHAHMPSVHLSDNIGTTDVHHIGGVAMDDIYADDAYHKYYHMRYSLSLCILVYSNIIQVCLFSVDGDSTAVGTSIDISHINFDLSDIGLFAPERPDPVLSSA